jgi:hypothetical protein
MNGNPLDKRFPPAFLNKAKHGEQNATRSSIRGKIFIHRKTPINKGVSCDLIRRNTRGTAVAKESCRAH